MNTIRVSNPDVEVKINETGVADLNIEVKMPDIIHFDPDAEVKTVDIERELLNFKRQKRTIKKPNDLTYDKKQEAEKNIVSTRNGCIQAFFNRHVRCIKTDACNRWFFRPVKRV